MTFQNIALNFRKENYILREDPRIREQEWGHLRDIETNNSIEDQRDNFGTFYFRIPNGESCADVYDRVSDFFNTLHRDFEKEEFPENAIIVTHGMTIRCFLMRWFHWTVEEFERLANPTNGDAIHLQLDKATNKYRLQTELKRKKVEEIKN